jgi:hypothetical protein
MSASCDVERPPRAYEQVLIGRVLSATRETLRQQTDDELRTVYKFSGRAHLSVSRSRRT